MSSNKGLIVSPVASDPQHSGNSARVRQIADALDELGWDMHFCLYPIRPINSRYSESAMQKAWGDKLHIIGEGSTYTGSAYQRLLIQIQKRVRRHSKKIQLNWILDKQLADGYVSPAAKNQLAHLHKELKPQFVLVEYAIISAIIAKLFPTTHTVLDTHDRFANRNARLRLEGCNDRWVSLTEQQENKLLHRFKEVLAIQATEKTAFETQLSKTEPQPTVRLVDILCRPIEKVNPCNGPTFGFIGSANVHNTNGLSQFIRQHWSSISSRIPNAQLEIAGDVAKKHQDVLNIKYVGRVENLATFYQNNSVIINPCLTGTGLKIKSVEALQHGRALVTTPEGASGIEDAAPNSMRISKLGTQVFTDSCVEVATSSRLITEMGKNAREYIRTKRQAAMKALQKAVSRES